MRLSIIAVTTCVALVACQKQAESPPAESNVVAADANVGSAPAGMALASLNETSWEFVDPKSTKDVIESVDAKGDYITQGKDGSHVDHGTAVMKDGKGCFTSKMNADGEMCWSDPLLAVGQSGETTSDKGDKLAIKRVDYKALTM
jgi:hypothetical protein